MKIGRNEPCPCNSGKKYKKCCIQKDAEEKKSLEHRCNFCKEKLESESLNHKLIHGESIDGVYTEEVFYFCSNECKWASALESHILMGMDGHDAVVHLLINHDFTHEDISVAINMVMEKGNHGIKKIISNEMDNINHLIS